MTKRLLAVVAIRRPFVDSDVSAHAAMRGSIPTRMTMISFAVIATMMRNGPSIITYK
jgi:hypothetical protein